MAAETPNGTHDEHPHNKLVERASDTPSRKPSPQPTHLSVPGHIQKRTLRESGPGYVAPKFEGKQQQMDEVEDLLSEKGFLPEDFVESETKWFYTELGIDDSYFRSETADAIASHIHSLYAAKIAAYARDSARLDIRLDKEATDHAVYIDTSTPGVTMVEGAHYERRIDTKYLNTSNRKLSYRVETFRSNSALPGGQDERLRCYFVYQCDFVNSDPAQEETNIEVIGDRRFLQKATKNTKDIYQEIVRVAVNRSGPVIELFDIEGSSEKRVVVAYKQGSALGFFSALSLSLIHI